MILWRKDLLKITSKLSDWSSLVDKGERREIVYVCVQLVDLDWGSTKIKIEDYFKIKKVYF